MDVTQAQAGSSGPGSQGTGQTPPQSRAISADFETFLKMLTVQMTNQDPLNPIDSADYAVQLATFSGVEQQVLTNDLLKTLAAQIGTSGMAQMAAWVGKEARAATPVAFDGDPITISPNPATLADRVELVVLNEDGMEVQRSRIPVSADPIQWSGRGADGALLPHGTYSFHVVSYAGTEQLVDDLAEVYSTIHEVRVEGGETILMLEGDVPVRANDITALRDPTLI
jgi:flagellar basal-body rod modification protein FlgD